MNTQHTRFNRLSPLLTLMVLPVLALSTGALPRAAGAEPAKAPSVAKESKPAAGGQAVKPAAAAAGQPSRKVLLFRNVRSWKRKVDFEEALTNLGFKFDVKSSADMASTDLSPYGVVIIPGAQWQDDYYQDYAANSDRFDRYVTNGGTLV